MRNMSTSAVMCEEESESLLGASNYTGPALQVSVFSFCEC